MTDHEAYVANVMHQRGYATEVVARALGFIGTDETILGCEPEPSPTVPTTVRHLTEDERKEIRAMLRDGVPPKIIAQRTGRTPTTIYRIRRELSA